MEFTKDARQGIEDWLKQVMRHATLTVKDREEAIKELRSTIYERADVIARERGSVTVTLEDVKKAAAGEQAPEEIAACYSKTYAAGLKRAGFWRKAIAYSLDMGLVIGLLVIGMIVSAGLSPSYQASMASDGTPDIVWTLVSLALGLGYFTALEGCSGRTIGKYLLGLKVLKTEGTRIGFREAFLRNLTTTIGFPFFMIIDALLMLFFFRQERQRAFDKIAGTMVVSTRG